MLGYRGNESNNSTLINLYLLSFQTIRVFQIENEIVYNEFKDEYTIKMQPMFAYLRWRKETLQAYFLSTQYLRELQTISSWRRRGRDYLWILFSAAQKKLDCESSSWRRHNIGISSREYPSEKAKWIRLWYAAYWLRCRTGEGIKIGSIMLDT